MTLPNSSPWNSQGCTVPFVINIYTFSLSTKHSYFTSLLWVSILKWSVFDHPFVPFTIFYNLLSFVIPKSVPVQLSILPQIQCETSFIIFDNLPSWTFISKILPSRDLRYRNYLKMPISPITYPIPLLMFISCLRMLKGRTQILIRQS